MPTKQELLAQLQELKKQRQALDAPVPAPTPDNGFFTEATGGPGGLISKGVNFAGQVGTGALNTIKSLIPRDPFEGNILNNDGSINAENEARASSEFQDALIHPISNSIPIPGLNTAIRAGEDYFANKFLGDQQAPMPSAGEYGKQVFQGVGQGIGGAGAMYLGAKALPLVTNPTAAVQTITDAVVGKPEARLLAEQAGNADIIANKLNYPINNSAAERNMVQSSMRSSDTFAKINPTAGIDTSVTSPLSGREQMLQMKQNLQNADIAATLKRKAILAEASTQENNLLKTSVNANGTPANIGISFDNLPTTIKTPKGDFGLEHIANNTPGGQPGVDLATEYVKSKFGIEPSPILDAQGNPIGNTTGKILSAQESNVVRQQLDAQIREVGGYDQTYWTQKGMNPSVADSYAEGLRFYKQQLDAAVKDHISKVLGPDKAQEFTEAGNINSAAYAHIPMIDRAVMETGQAYLPGRARSVKPGQGIMSASGNVVNGVLEEVFPGSENRKMQAGDSGLRREANIVRQLSQIIELKNNPQPLLPRGIAQIKASAQNMGNFANIAMGLGLIGSPDQLQQLPDPALSSILAQIGQGHPELLEPTPDKVNAIDGKLSNPLDKDMLARQAMDLSPEKRAGAMVPLFQNKYVPPSPGQTPVSSPSFVPQIDSISSLIPEIEPGPRMPTSSLSLIDQLNSKMSKHAEEWH